MEAHMESLYSIASLPRPFDADQGRIHAAPVHGINIGNARKRKRHEIAVGVDGEGVNIYNVQSQSHLTSYPIPPHAYLCCPPSSVHVRPAGDAPSRRQTYVVLRDGPSDTKTRLLCVTEELHASQRHADDVSGVSKRERKLPTGAILGLDVLPTRASHHVLVSYKDGRVECVAADVAGTVWQHSEKSRDSEVEYAVLTDVEAARKGLLAGREDVQAALETAGAANQALLVQVTRQRSNKRLRLYAIRASSPQVIQSQKPALRLVMESELSPTREHEENKNTTYELHAATGMLYELHAGRLTPFDLTGVSPRPMTRLGGGAEYITSFARISTSSVLAVSAGKAVVYETKYGAAQASVNLKDAAITAGPGQKRKLLADSTSSGPLHALAFFSALGIFVGLSGHDLKGAQLNDDLRRAKRSKTGSTLLVDVLDRGSASEEVKNEKQARRIAEWKAEVDAAVGTNDIESLEVLSASALRLRTSSDLNAEGVEKAVTRSANNADENEASAAEDEQIMIARQLQSDSMEVDRGDKSHGGEWIATAETFDTANINREHVHYLLSKLFRLNADPGASTRLQPTTDADNTYVWLALTGFLTTSHIQRALARHTASPSDLQLQQGDVMAAFGSMDNNFQLVHDLLALPIHWQIPDVAQALSALIRSFDTPDEASALTTLPSRSTLQDLTNGPTSAATSSETDIATEEAAAERDLAFTINVLSRGLETRSSALRLALSRLQTFPPKSITKALRAHLRPEEIVFLMRVLRIELIDGGWTKQYLQQPHSTTITDDTVVPADTALISIALLLDCSIDAIGTSGWLIGQASGRLGAVDLLEGLKVEASAALEGLYGLETLATYLEDFERTASSLAKAAEGADERVEKLKAVSQGGAVMGEEVQAEDVLMPMGGRFETRTVGVGGKRKGRHEIMQERRRKVGSYSIERIRV